MYTRRGCHLCEEAWVHLLEAQQRHAFALTATDVDADPALVARYDKCVPVVTVNGTERFRGKVNPVLLERLLHAEGRRQAEGSAD
jgi:hypothetical protein